VNEFSIAQHVINFLRDYIPRNQDSLLSLKFFNYYFNVPGDRHKEMQVLYSKYGYDINEVEEKLRNAS
jgi:hypothetical protein